VHIVLVVARFAFKVQGIHPKSVPAHRTCKPLIKSAPPVHCVISIYVVM